MGRSIVEAAGLQQLTLERRDGLIDRIGRGSKTRIRANPLPRTELKLIAVSAVVAGEPGSDFCKSNRTGLRASKAKRIRFAVDSLFFRLDVGDTWGNVKRVLALAVVPLFIQLFVNQFVERRGQLAGGKISRRKLPDVLLGNEILSTRASV